MKHLAIATFILGIFVTAANAQAYKAVTFNGMVFDTPSAQGSEGQQPTPKAKTAHHAKKRANHKHSAS
jgi:hypothetical protein